MELFFFPVFNYFRSEIIAKEDGVQLEAASLPLVIRERDTEYQFHRIVLCDRLIKVSLTLYSSLVQDKKVKLPLCLTRHHAMETNWGSEGIGPHIFCPQH
jgi:TBC domain-containing protein kinase-like protein